MTTSYNPKTLENDVQQLWTDRACFHVTETHDKPKYYSLCMFPYPSGQLHMGHVRNYTIGDVVMRYQRMQGKNVLQPMGWDAFGLPAENAAIKHHVHPAEWTYKNIAAMREQLQQLGFGYDWQRELTTCEPEYYRWEQWLFTRLFEKKLVYKKNAVVNWDPVDQTVLANEQVVNGRGWRSGAEIERREISQWFLRITAYADELLDGLEHLTQWPEQVRTMQRNWIGRSHGAEVYFDVIDHEFKIDIFTTRVDTLMGATYIAIAAEHPLAKEVAQDNPAIQAFIEECRHIKTSEEEIATMEKRGIATNLHARHPLTNELLPIWIANFVLMDYGTGAVMAVPAHDPRDYEFAKKYHLPIKQVLQPPADQSCDLEQAAYVGPGTLMNSGEFDGLDWQAALQKIPQKLVALKHGEPRIQYRLRDWGISRQRYWGTPIPIIHCDACGSVPVPEKDLPVVLPKDVEFSGARSPLKEIADFYQTTCPACGQAATRETDTFDTFVESSWYYARYASFDQAQAMLDDRADYWTPVDYYIGGVEHAVMHLLYARFFHKLLRDEGLVHSDEPFKKLLTQGMVLKDGQKMSKSKGNTVDPHTLIAQYGADTVRLFTMFAAPPDQSLEWSDSGVEGTYRFLKRLWQFAQDAAFIKTLNSTAPNADFSNLTQEQQTCRTHVHQILHQANQDMARSQFNTVVSAGMKLLNTLSEHCAKTTEPGMQVICQEGFRILLRLLAPIVPHITQHLWQHLGYGELIIDAPWPTVDDAALQTQTIELIVQVNGKLRGRIQVASDADKQTIETHALQEPNIQKFIADKNIKKVVVVPKRLVNVVVG